MGGARHWGLRHACEGGGGGGGALQAAQRREAKRQVPQAAGRGGAEMVWRPAEGDAVESERHEDLSLGKLPAAVFVALGERPLRLRKLLRSVHAGFRA